MDKTNSNTTATDNTAADSGDNSISFINIIIQTYDEKRRDRRDELTHCIIANLHNKYIKRIYDLSDTPFINDNTINADNINADNADICNIASHPKYIHIKSAERLTYRKIFEFANIHKLSYCAYLNCDIMLSPSVNWSNTRIFLDMPHTILALSRHEYDIYTESATMDTEFAALLHSHTQDAWFFKTPMIVPQNCDIKIGQLGCDNAIAHRLKMAGYTIINKPEEFQIFHIDSVRGKNATNYQTHHHKSDHPELDGYYLVPNYDQLMRNNMTIDKIADIFHLTPTEKYNIICEIFTRKIIINNTPPPHTAHPH